MYITNVNEKQGTTSNNVYHVIFALTAQNDRYTWPLSTIKMQVKMKTLKLLLIVFTLTSNSLSAQGFLEGTPEWNYCYECQSFMWNYKGQTSIKYDSDILYQDTIVKLFIVSSNYISQSINLDDFERIDSIYLYEEGAQLFKWNFPSNTKKLLYDFDAELNDTLLVTDAGNNQLNFILDSIGTIEISGMSLRTQKLKIKSGCFLNNRTVTLIEKIGAINKAYFEIIDSYSCWQDACIQAHQLTNYNNEELGINYGISQNCEGVTSTNNQITKEGYIYPNPASNLINIENFELFDQIEFYNTIGQKIISKRILNKNIEINLESGVYIVVLKRKDNKISTIKLYVSKSG